MSWFNGMKSKHYQLKTSITIGEVIAIFLTVEDGFIFTQGFNCPHVFRGNYSEIGFEPCENISAGEIKNNLIKAITDVFVSTKGDECRYNLNSICNLSIKDEFYFKNESHKTNFIELILTMIDEYNNRPQTYINKHLILEEI